jgi:hypothetical protein
MSKKWIAGSLIALTAATSFGCAGATSPSQTPTTPMAATAQADRHVQAVGDNMTFNQIVDQLPKRISEADAARMLVTIDPSKVVDENTYTVQQRGRGFGGGFRGGMGRGIGAFGHRGFYGGFRGNYGRYRYFGHGGRYFPYYLNRGYYYPYSYGSVYPYFYNYANSYYPYSCGLGAYGWGYLVLTLGGPLRMLGASWFAPGAGQPGQASLVVNYPRLSDPNNACMD